MIRLPFRSFLIEKHLEELLDEPSKTETKQKEEEELSSSSSIVEEKAEEELKDEASLESALSSFRPAEDSVDLRKSLGHKHVFRCGMDITYV